MAGNILTVLSAGTYVRGDVYSKDTLVVEGGVEGNLVGNRVIVKKQGWVHGNLSCRALSIEPGGVVDGDVHVTSAMTLDQLQAATAQALEQQKQAGQLAAGQDDDEPMEYDLDQPHGRES